MDCLPSARQFCSRLAISSATRAPKTTASRSEFEASRFAYVLLVQATSPQAHKPVSVVRPRASVRTPPDVVMSSGRKPGCCLMGRSRFNANLVSGGKGLFRGGWSGSRETPHGQPSLLHGRRGPRRRGVQFGAWWCFQHEAFATAVDEKRAVAAYRFRSERRGVLPDIEWPSDGILNELGTAITAPARAAMPRPPPLASFGLVVTRGSSASPSRRQHDDTRGGQQRAPPLAAPWRVA